MNGGVKAESLEIHSPGKIQQKLREVQMIARSAVQAQLLELMPASGPMADDRPRNGHDGRNGNGHNGNGRRSHGRPTPPVTPKQPAFLCELARERNLDAEAVGQICERGIGVPLRSCSKDRMSQLIDCILADGACGRAPA